MNSKIFFKLLNPENSLVQNSMNKIWMLPIEVQTELAAMRLSGARVVRVLIQ